MAKKRFLIGMLAMALALGMAVTSCDNILPPDTPSNVTVTGQTLDSITLGWNDVPGADGYYVYKQTSYGFERLSGETYITRANIYNLSPDTSYTFRVSAFNRAGESGQSYSVTGKTGYPSLNGIWKVKSSDSEYITVSGSSGTLNGYNPTDAIWIDAKNKGYYNTGDVIWRNLAKTDDLKWSGECKGISWNTSNPNVATGPAWRSMTITMSANGQTITAVSNWSSGTSNITCTRQ